MDLIVNVASTDSNANSDGTEAVQTRLASGRALSLVSDLR